MPFSEDVDEARERALKRLSPGENPTRQQVLTDPTVRQHFAELLAQVDMLIPEGREKSLAVTKIEEASMWAIKGLYSDSNNYYWKKN